jgi:hypothetical protein
MKIIVGDHATLPSTHGGVPTPKRHRITVVRTAIISASMLTLIACGTPSPQGLGPQGQAKLKDKTLVIANTASRPDFRAFTPGKAAFSLLGDVVMVSEGNRIATQNALVDPAIAIARDLALQLNNSVGTRWSPTSAAIASDSGSAAALSAKATGANLVLSVRTQDWRTWYYTTNFNRYRARVEVSAELIDTATQAVIAQATCDESSPQSPDASPTFDEMVGTGAQRLKDELARAQSACVAVLKKGLLGG